MTDLIRFHDRWYCVFREADKHAQGQDGIIRILTSEDSLQWHSAGVFALSGVDLRDPKLSITSTGQLMLLTGGLEWRDAKIKKIHSLVAFSEDGLSWNPLQRILGDNEWLWRATWYKGKVYGAAYRLSNLEDRYEEWNIRLLSSDNGLDYNGVADWDIQGYPNETTLRFLPSGEMVALVRREKKHDNAAWLGFSDPPYNEWRWNPTSHYVGGPNFFITHDCKMWVGGRLMFSNPYVQVEKMFVGCVEAVDVMPLLILPSGGDCSYPGMVYHEGLIWMSYYSSHEGKASIYLARIAI